VANYTKVSPGYDSLNGSRSTPYVFGASNNGLFKKFDAGTLPNTQPEETLRSPGTAYFPLETEATKLRRPRSPNLPAAAPVTGSMLGDRQYQYKPLKDLWVRLVRILPERKTMIKCEIVHAPLAHPPRYVAISYAWGDAGDTRKIELDGSLIPISVNLHGAFQAVRQKFMPILVWADALSIDQRNMEERTQQIRLMPRIYASAESVAVWLGPEEDESSSAISLLEEISELGDKEEALPRLIHSEVSGNSLGRFPAVAYLFERDYWHRLWVVQEVFSARSVTVYCGNSHVSWDVFQRASEAFFRHREGLNLNLSKAQGVSQQMTTSPDQFSCSQVLIYQGPASLPDGNSFIGLGEESLLEALRACRRKFASDPKDKLFGILGILPREVQQEFRADYSRSLKDVYTEVVDYLLKATDRVDVICDAIQPLSHKSSTNLPSFVPDWSYMPHLESLGHKYKFRAGGSTKARCKFTNEKLNKLEISAIYLDTITIHGTMVNTVCTVGDYLMAFLHWRAVLSESIQNEDVVYKQNMEKQFVEVLCLGQVPPHWDDSGQWATACCHVFASLLRDRLPHLQLDPALHAYIDARLGIEPKEMREFLQQHFGDRMMGRRFCRTTQGLIGMGSGSLLPGDIVVVPLGCSTPVLLRQAGTRDEYRFVGDVYIQGYMHGMAVDEWMQGSRGLKQYVLL